MGNFVWIVLVVLMVLLVLGALSSMSRRRSVVGGETVATGGGFGTGLLVGILVIIAALVILALGLFQWNWFGSQPLGGSQNPAITSPAPGGGASSPSTSPS